VSEIYLDYNSTTPLSEEARRAMEPFWSRDFANPASVHRAGQRVRHAMEAAREQVAKAIGAGAEEIFFTSGGTEANNLALIGVLPERAPSGRRGLYTSPIEHSSIVGPADHLSKTGLADLVAIPADREGFIRPEALGHVLRPGAALVSVMHANNEVGTIEPIVDLATIAHGAGALFHTDAVQTCGKVPIDVKAMGCDFVTLGAHKFGGPKGVGALYVKGGVKLKPILYGGSQEKNLRAGTVNVAGIVGMGAAAESAARHCESAMKRLLDLRRFFLREIQRAIPNVETNGPADDAFVIPSTINLRLAGVDAHALMTNLDLLGICVSMGSACASGSVQPSRVLLALGLSLDEARSSLRVSTGHETTEEHLKTFIREAAPIIERLRKSGNAR